VAGGLLFSVKDEWAETDHQGILSGELLGGILAGEYVNQEPGAMDKSWSLSYQAYQSMVNTVGIDRVVFTTDWPYGSMKAARQSLTRCPSTPMIRRRSRTATRSACSVSVKTPICVEQPLECSLE
jgi:hypothetical protein